MLTLTRRIGETLMIGDWVAVTVLGIKGDQVRIGIAAPKHLAVHRREIYQRIQRGEGAGQHDRKDDAGSCARSDQAQHSHGSAANAFDDGHAKVIA